MKAVTLLASLPQLAYDAKQVQLNEVVVAKQQALPMYRLMERAGAAAFDCLRSLWPQASCYLMVCGKGNNGGDGLIIARMALEAGFTVSVLLLGEQAEIQGDALTALQQFQRVGGTIDMLTQTNLVQQRLADFNGDLIIDCIFGIGFHGKLSNFYRSVIWAINAHSAIKFSVDVPSGLCANTGTVSDIAITAAATVTFIAIKKGLLTGQAANYVGALYLAGLSLNMLFTQLVPGTIAIQGPRAIPQLPLRPPASHKGNIGLVLAVGGNKGMPGAIRLAGEAALRSGAALAAVSCRQENQAMVCAGRPELMLGGSCADELINAAVTQQAKVVIIGPGLGRDDWARAMFNVVMTTATAKVVDADALFFLSQSPMQCQHWVLTPHPGEAAALLACSVQDIEADRYGAVAAIAKKYGGVCVLKGAGSLISDGERVWINTSGNAGMASGGMGDVLSGIIAAMILQLPDLLAAARLGVYLHGLAADKIVEKSGPRGLLASDLLPQLRLMVNAIP